MSVTEIDSPTQMASELGPRNQAAVPRRREFRANRSARGLVARFGPLEAVRDLGLLPPERVGELGFDSMNKGLTVAYETGAESFDVGGHPPESPHIYLRRRSDGRIYLVRADPLWKLEDGEAFLLDRRLHGFAFSDIDRAIVIAGDRRRELVRRVEKDRTPVWVDPTTPEERNDIYESWLRQAHQLSVKELLPLGAVAVLNTPLVTIEYYQGPAKQGRLELIQETVEHEVGKRFCARSEHTLRWARVAGARAEAVARDLDEVLSP